MGRTIELYLCQGVFSGIKDTSSLGTVIIRHCGYTAVIEVVSDVKEKSDTQDIEIADQPVGGANSRSINSLRLYFRSLLVPDQPEETSHLYAIWMIQKLLEVLSIELSNKV